MTLNLGVQILLVLGELVGFAEAGFVITKVISLYPGLYEVADL